MPKTLDEAVHPSAQSEVLDLFNDAGFSSWKRIKAVAPNWNWATVVDSMEERMNRPLTSKEGAIVALAINWQSEREERTNRTISPQYIRPPPGLTRPDRTEGAANMQRIEKALVYSEPPKKVQRTANLTPVREHRPKELFHRTYETLPLEKPSDKYVVRTRKPEDLKMPLPRLSRMNRVEPSAGKLQSASEIEIDRVWTVCKHFKEYSGLIQAAVRTGKSEQFIKRTCMQALEKGKGSTRRSDTLLRHVEGYLEYVRNFGSERDPLAGNDAMFMLADFIRTTRLRGVTVPEATRAGLKSFANALSIEWDLDNRLIVKAAEVIRNDTPKQAPALSVETVMKLENLAGDTKNPLAFRVFCSAVCLSVHGSFRFADCQSIDKLTVTEKCIKGITTTKTSKGNPIPWAVPRTGFNNADTWWKPLIEMRSRYEDKFGYPPTFIFMKNQDDWSELDFTRATYCATRKNLYKVFLSLKVSDPEQYTIHSCRSVYPTAGMQLNLSRDQQTKMGRWCEGSKMPDVYDRSTCTEELAIRRKIMESVQEGFRPKGPFEENLENMKKHTVTDASAEPSNPSAPTQEAVTQKEISASNKTTASTKSPSHPPIRHSSRAERDSKNEGALTSVGTPGTLIAATAKAIRCDPTLGSRKEVEPGSLTNASEASPNDARNPDDSQTLTNDCSIDLDLVDLVDPLMTYFEQNSHDNEEDREDALVAVE